MQDPYRGRPIAMSNSIYRLLMRWVHATLYPLISPHLHPRQFGGKQGHSPAQATHAFMHDLEQFDRLEAILAFDVYHAFDSPPKHLIRTVLDRLGKPLKLLHIISLALDHGATFITGALDEVFTTTHGVKRGCPLSCFLFVVVFEIRLHYLARRGIVFCAYVDNISAPVPPGRSQAIFDTVQEALSLIACQCNVLKSECLPLVSPPPVAPSLPRYLHPSTPVLVSGPSPWSSVHAEEPPTWALSTVHPFRVVPHLMHLGHPLPACFDLRSAFDLIGAELSAQIAELHAQPIQVLDRVLLVNTMILPRLLYRTECLPLSLEQSLDVSSVVERFVLGVTGVPPLVTKKTLYTHRRHGLGLSYFPVLHPTRVLDALHRNTGLPEFSISPPSFPLSPYNFFMSAASQLGSPKYTPTPPLPVLWQAQSTMRDAISILSISGLTVYLLPHRSSPDATYTDGSKLGDPRRQAPLLCSPAALSPSVASQECQTPTRPS